MPKFCPLGWSQYLDSLVFSDFRAARSAKKKIPALEFLSKLLGPIFFFALRAQTIILSFWEKTQERYTDFQI